MKISRRKFNIGAAASALPMFTLAKPAIAQVEPIRIGWLAAMTGASSAPAIGFDRGVQYAAGVINAAGGVKGRKIEILTRDTQGGR
jgi:branched-chain amino acid transport system substrate-binding protein